MRSLVLPIVPSFTNAEQPSYYSQKRDLVKTKELFPEFKEIHSQVLQDCVERVKKAFDRFQKGDCKGKKSGKPRFKGIGRYRSFTYTQMKQDCISNRLINLPKIGKVKLIQHRELPVGFTNCNPLGEGES